MQIQCANCNRVVFHKAPDIQPPDFYSEAGKEAYSGYFDEKGFFAEWSKDKEIAAQAVREHILDTGHTEYDGSSTFFNIEVQVRFSEQGELFGGIHPVVNIEMTRK